MSDSLSILIAIDSFKESLSAVDAGKALRKGIQKAAPDTHIRIHPMADGGEGTVEAVISILDGEKMSASVHDPLMRPIQAQYGIVRSKSLAIIEMAAASGLELLRPSEQDAAITTTFGTGELIRHALDEGCRNFIIGIGGSATNDGGAGMLYALNAGFETGIKPYSHGGIYLKNIANINLQTLDPRLREARFRIACDVDNPLTGPNGASRIYGPQKGARPEVIGNLDDNLQHFGELLEKATGRSIIQIPGAGAAGGLGAGLLALPHAELHSGFNIIADATGLEKAIAEANWVITGEGKVDGQTLSGKVPYGVGRLAKKHQKPALCVAGTIGTGYEALYEHGITAFFSLVNAPMTLSEAKSEAAALLEKQGENLIRLIVATGENRKETLP